MEMKGWFSFVDGTIFFSLSPSNEHITFRIAKTCDHT